MHVRAESLTYVYAPHTPLARTGVWEVNLEIEPGRRVGISGPTGSGKSTLVQLLAGLLRPTSGQVLLDGVPAHGRTAEARERRRRVGLAFQYPERQFFEQTVFQEVAFGPRNLGVGEAEVAERVRWALELVGLSPEQVEGRVPFSLSGGEMRRVALASILAMRPEVLILDEPTAGLDPGGRRGLLTRLRRWQEATHATLILVSHDLDEMAPLVERTVLLAEGQIVADGPTRRVLGDERALQRAGLAPPQTVRLLHRLRAAGWPVRTDRLRPDEAVAEIAGAYRRMGGGR